MEFLINLETPGSLIDKLKTSELVLSLGVESLNNDTNKGLYLIQVELSP